MKDSCSLLSSLLERYLDHEATAEERSSVAVHLQGCPACRNALRMMEEMGRLIKAPVDEAEQEEDFSRVWQRIEKGIQQGERAGWGQYLRLPDIASLFQKKIWIPAAAALIAIIVAITPSILKRGSSPSEASVVEYVESDSCNVMVYQLDKGNETVIWLFEGPAKEGSSTS